MASGLQPLFSAPGSDRNNSDSKNNPAAAIPAVAPRKKRILHVEFDRILLATRHALLETAGFDVISCFSALAAREVSTSSRPFDIFLIGHAASMDLRNDLITWVRAQFPGIAIVALRSRDTDYSPLGDALAVADPDELIKVIVEVARSR